ncbi:trichohyalin-like [Elysia marginata]|uniref:Trichohyalin-like n=1 Tax=Elysia marginata TaxID=1093978 RepID=A0AAV4HQS0_9GAST|nr:trichohyalin-like [Elysia marginata]
MDSSKIVKAGKEIGSSANAPLHPTSLPRSNLPTPSPPHSPSGRFQCHSCLTFPSSDIRIKQKKIKASQKSSRRRQELLKAREFGMKQQLEQEKTNIEDSLKQAEIKREQRLIEVKEKQRMRAERAKRARERAKQIQNPDDEVEVEKDEEFNAVSDDSWLDQSSAPSADKSQDVGLNGDVDEEEHVQKKVRQVRPTVSASTVDSFDGAFSRSGPRSHGIESATNNEDLRDDDDFFGS